MGTFVCLASASSVGILTANLIVSEQCPPLLKTLVLRLHDRLIVHGSTCHDPECLRFVDQAGEYHTSPPFETIGPYNLLCHICLRGKSTELELRRHANLPQDRHHEFLLCAREPVAVCVLI